LRTISTKKLSLIIACNTHSIQYKPLNIACNVNLDIAMLVWKHHIWSRSQNIAFKQRLQRCHAYLLYYFAWKLDVFISPISKLAISRHHHIWSKSQNIAFKQRTQRCHAYLLYYFVWQLNVSYFTHIQVGNFKTSSYMKSFSKHCIQTTHAKMPCLLIILFCLEVRCFLFHPYPSLADKCLAHLFKLNCKNQNVLAADWNQVCWGAVHNLTNSFVGDDDGGDGGLGIDMFLTSENLFWFVRCVNTTIANTFLNNFSDHLDTTNFNNLKNYFFICKISV
jgi:hypothetical protein